MEKIDIVITWVDGSDKEWVAERNSYSKEKIDESRYRDWDLLKYWFRSIEKNIDWYNKIYFITWGHIPEWLNVNNSRLVIVRHNQFIPNKYLPTFNSCTIELNLHRIKGLSDKFIYFNDDMFVNKKAEINDFFVNNLPVDSKILKRIWPIGKNSTIINYNCMKLIEKHFEQQQGKYAKKTLKELCKDIIAFPKKSIISYIPIHICCPYNKSTFLEVWDSEYELLNEICQHKFRTNDDVSQWLMEFWQIASNKYNERDLSNWEYLELRDDNMEEIYRKIKFKEKKFICLNDNEKLKQFDKAKFNIIRAFEENYPDKSNYEK